MDVLLYILCVFVIPFLFGYFVVGPAILWWFYKDRIR